MQHVLDSNKKYKLFLEHEFSKLRDKGETIATTSKYFGLVGSTQYEDIPYESQLEVKHNSLKKIFGDAVPSDILDELKVVPSTKTYGCRFKMDFVCSYNPKFEPFSRFGQRKRGNFNWVVDMHECNLIENAWFKKIRDIYDFSQTQGIKNYNLKTYEGDLRYFVSRIHNDQSMLSIVTKTNVNADKLENIAAFARKLGFTTVYWLVQPSVGDVSTGSVDRFWGSKYIEINLRKNEFYVGPDTFFQNNIETFKELLSYLEGLVSAIKKFDPAKATLYDFYSGVGTIGLSLSDKFKRVKGVDINRENILLAQKAIKKNNIRNASYGVGDVSKLNHGFNTYSFAVVDPPRSGLGESGVGTLLGLLPEAIIYISCNPISQRLDLEAFKSSYHITSMRAFDFFPHTNHIENVLLLRKN